MKYQIFAAGQGLYNVDLDGRNVAKICNENKRGQWLLYVPNGHRAKLDVTDILHHENDLDKAIENYLK